MENQRLIPSPPAAGLSGAGMLPREGKAGREKIEAGRDKGGWEGTEAGVEERLRGEGGWKALRVEQRLDSVDMPMCHLALCSSVQTPNP